MKEKKVVGLKEPNIKSKFKKVAIYYAGECMGNAEKSAVMAGYSPKYARGNAYKIIKRKDVQEYLKYLHSLAKAEEQKQIATIADIQEFWTKIMNDKEQTIKNRLKASELLAKAQGAFNNEW